MFEIPNLLRTNYKKRDSKYETYKKITELSPRMAIFDTEEIYGNNVLSKGHIFQTGSAATIYIQEYCFNQIKQWKVKRCSDASKMYVCAQVVCPWEVRVTRRQRKSISLRTSFRLWTMFTWTYASRLPSLQHGILKLFLLIMLWFEVTSASSIRQLWR